MRTFIRGIHSRGVPTAALALAMIGATLSPVHAHSTKGHAAHTSAGGSARSYEIRFLKQMIDHHLMAVKMGQECAQKSTHPELTQLCQKIGTDQAEEITQMRGWLNDWYGQSYQGKPMAMRGTSLSVLTGEKYERAFLNTMNQHHMMAVRMAKECERRATHAELKAAAHDIVTTQSEEIATMKRWLCDWYRDCKPGRTS